MLTHDANHLQNYQELLRAAKTQQSKPDAKKLNIAFLGDVSFQHIGALARALFLRHHIDAEIYEGAYGSQDMETRDQDSQLYAFSPDIIVLLSSTQGIREQYYVSGSQNSFASDIAARAESVWHAIRARTNALIIQGTIVLPYERLFGNFDSHVPHSLSCAVSDINRLLIERAREQKNIRILDMEHIASYMGRGRWFDEKLWVTAKTLCALEYLPVVAQHIADITLSTEGRGVKCIILDLDNTLWGGVVGNDGLEGIRLGHDSPEGQAFSLFQKYLAALKQRGVVLAVCSKNNEETARKVFREHPDMILKENDIAVFVANWENKADNIRHIQRVLNIGFDSLVFLDDNPFERNLVRNQLPDVIVPELPEDPADYIKFLSELNLFETASFSEEDTKRADMYREEATRTTFRQEFSDIGAYLKSLEMKACVARFDEFHIPRIAQLILRSNQFNLTTKRHSEADCANFMREEQTYYPFYATLRDAFGDYGLIGIVILRREEKNAFIDTWLMSCRVLSRGIEEVMMNHAVAKVQEWECDTLVGEYIPTAKNAMVKDFFGRFEFMLVSDNNGTTKWHLVPHDWQEKKTFISIV